MSDPQNEAIYQAMLKKHEDLTREVLRLMDTDLEILYPFLATQKEYVAPFFEAWTRPFKKLS